MRASPFQSYLTDRYTIQIPTSSELRYTNNSIPIRTDNDEHLLTEIVKVKSASTPARNKRFVEKVHALEQIEVACVFVIVMLTVAALPEMRISTLSNNFSTTAACARWSC